MSDHDTPDGYVPFSSDSSRNTDVIKALTRVGIVLYGAWVFWLFQVLYRVSNVSAGLGSGLWEQRVEDLAFIGFLPNLPVLGLVAVLASAATWLAGPTQQLELAILLRLTRWTANALVVVALLSVVTPVFGVSGGLDDIGTIAFRASGAIGAFAISTLCREAGRNAPGG
ncbi:MAG: hypothetical protein WA964_22015 [Ilumatobacter sp.]|uniref:hypothetical protein n=1 Tax=Ilumatobacter sp. TaxID=1967498 RepID=UPI003C7707F7